MQRALIYCIRCKKLKSLKSIKACIDKKHTYVVFDKFVKFDDKLIEENNDENEAVEEVAERIWRSRFIDTEDEAVEVYDYNKQLKELILNPSSEAICPVHQKRAYGFCFSCDRFICLEEKTHFKHVHLLFSDFGFENKPSSKRAPTLEDETTHRAHLIAVINESLDKKQAILKQSIEIRDKLIRTTLLTALDSSSTITRNSCIQVANLLSLADDAKFESDFEHLNKQLNRELVQLKLASMPIEMRVLLKHLTEEVKSKHRVIGTDNYSFMLFGVPLYMDEAGLYYTENSFRRNHDVIGFHFRFKRDSCMIAFRQTTREIRIQLTHLDTLETRFLEVAQKYKSFNHIERYVNVLKNKGEAKLHFVSEDDKLIEIDLRTAEARELCDCECKRLITVFESGDCFKFTDCIPEVDITVSESSDCIKFTSCIQEVDFTTQMIQKDDGSLWFRRNSDWKLIDYRPLDNEIEAFVRSPFSLDVNKGTFMSKNYIHRAGVPSTPIKCNSVYFDYRTVLVLNRSIKYLDSPYYL